MFATLIGGSAMTSAGCLVCRKNVKPVGPPRLAQVALVAGWVAAVASWLLIAALGTYMVILVPVLVIAGWAMLTPLHQWAGQPSTCPHCGCYVVRDPAPKARGDAPHA
jgi:hypothetical protein